VSKKFKLHIFKLAISLCRKKPAYPSKNIAHILIFIKFLRSAPNIWTICFKCSAVIGSFFETGLDKIFCCSSCCVYQWLSTKICFRIRFIGTFLYYQVVSWFQVIGKSVCTQNDYSYDRGIQTYFIKTSFEKRTPLLKLRKINVVLLVCWFCLSTPYNAKNMSFCTIE
jgi:hypothetical protein